MSLNHLKTLRWSPCPLLWICAWQKGSIDRTFFSSCHPPFLFCLRLNMCGVSLSLSSKNVIHKNNPEKWEKVYDEKEPRKIVGVFLVVGRSPQNKNLWNIRKNNPSRCRESERKFSSCGERKGEDPFSVCSELSFGLSSQRTVISVQGVCVERGEEKGEANFYFLKKKAFLTSRPRSGEQPQTETTKQKQI